MPAQRSLAAEPAAVNRYQTDTATLAPADVPRSARRETLRVLIVDSDDSRRSQTSHCLDAPGRESVQVVHADCASQATSLIAASKFGCLILSHSLRDANGIDVIESMDDRLLTTPIIVLLDKEDLALSVSYFRAGCVEITVRTQVEHGDAMRNLVADVMARFQRRVIATIIERQKLQQGIVESQEGLIALARTDPLMGICNRGAFDDYLESIHRQNAGCVRPYALLMIDVDRFKQYNDTYGHAAGDDALRAVAQALRSGLRENDFIARYGGEEIVIVLDAVSAQQACSIADRFRRAVYDRALPHAGNPPHGRVTVSIGAAVFDPALAMSSEDLLSTADAGLYAAKSAGRNRVAL